MRHRITAVFLMAAFFTTSAFADSMSFVVRYNDGAFPGNPASGATVKLKNAADQVFAQGTTDGNGQVTISYDPANPAVPQVALAGAAPSVSISAATNRTGCDQSVTEPLSNGALITLRLPCAAPVPPQARYLGGFIVGFSGQLFLDGNQQSIPGSGRTMSVFFEINGTDLDTNPGPNGGGPYTTSGFFSAGGRTAADGRFLIQTRVTLPPMFQGTVRVTSVRVQDATTTAVRDYRFDRVYHFNEPDSVDLEADWLTIGPLGIPELTTANISTTMPDMTGTAPVFPVGVTSPTPAPLPTATPPVAPTNNPMPLPTAIPASTNLP